MHTIKQKDVVPEGMTFVVRQENKIQCLSQTVLISMTHTKDLGASQTPTENMGKKVKIKLSKCASSTRSTGICVLNRSSKEGEIVVFCVSCHFITQHGFSKPSIIL